MTLCLFECSEFVTEERTWILGCLVYSEAGCIFLLLDKHYLFGKDIFFLIEKCYPLSVGRGCGVGSNGGVGNNKSALFIQNCIPVVRSCYALDTLDIILFYCFGTIELFLDTRLP